MSNRTHRIFRPSDLIHGEVLGKGCFGQAIKVRHSILAYRPVNTTCIITLENVCSHTDFVQKVAVLKSEAEAGVEPFVAALWITFLFVAHCDVTVL